MDCGFVRVKPCNGIKLLFKFKKLRKGKEKEEVHWQCWQIMHKKSVDLPSTCSLIWLQILFTATNLLVICNATGEILSVNQSCGGCPTTPTTHFYELVSSCVHVSSCTHKIITGYWVGPDIEDGWGFVEGFVNQITWLLFLSWMMWLAHFIFLVV